MYLEIIRSIIKAKNAINYDKIQQNLMADGTNI